MVRNHRGFIELIFGGRRDLETTVSLTEFTFRGWGIVTAEVTGASQS
jgi:hypothetical protein